MSKISLKSKAAKQYIITARENGKIDQEIYHELTEQHYDKKTIALLITGTPLPATKKKYKIVNNILLFLIGLTIVFKILIVVNLSVMEREPLTMLLILIVPVFNILFFYGIARYDAAMSRFCGLITIAGFMQTIGNAKNSTDIIISLAFTIVIAGLAFYLDAKMFPDYSPNGLRKDSNGEYIL